MKPRRSYFFRGLMTGLFIALSYKAFVAGSVITAIAGLAVVALISNAALGPANGE